jgi:NhaP-type Na+/H+ or K+/H+ antiporter
MLFVVGASEVRKHIKIPASILLVLSGLFLRLVGVYIGELKGAVSIWSNVDQWSVLLILLPALIFESGYSIDWYCFKRELPQILMMATSAVVLHAMLTAFVLKYILVFDFTWDQALLIGTLLSATDHVTVVNLVKELKTERTFEALIQGETLLIEGTVMVLFFVLMDRVTGGSLDVGGSFVTFVQLTLGGFALGLAFCVGFSWAVTRIMNDEVLEVNLTILTTYLSFFTAENVNLNVSGAISTVTFALFMSAYGKTLVSPAVEHSLHVFWKIIGKNVDGLIFVMAGIVLGDLSLSPNSVSRTDVWMTFVLFILLHIIRSLVVLLHYPLLYKFGLGLHWKQAVVLSLAGSKGVISLSLAVLIWHDTSMDNSFRDLALLIVVLCSALSIFLDSFIVWLSMRLLGMGTITEVREHSFLQVALGVVEAVDKQISKLNEEYKLVLWDQANRMAGTRPIVTTVMKQTYKGAEFLEEGEGLGNRELIETYFDNSEFDTGQIINEVRRRCMMTLKGLYWKHFNEGLCQGPSALKLIESADFCLEKLTCPVKDWEFIEAKHFSLKGEKRLAKMSRIWLIGRVFKSLHSSCMKAAYDVSSAFIHMHQIELEIFERMMKHIEPALVEKVRAEFEEQLNLAKEFRSNFVGNDYPDIVSYMQTKQASYSMLNTQRRTLNIYHEKGMLDKDEHELLTEVVNHQFKRLAFAKTPAVPDMPALLKSSAFVLGLYDEQIQTFIGLCREVAFKEEESIFDVGWAAEGCYFILRGRVLESGSGWSNIYDAGEAVGEHHLLPAVFCCESKAVALTPVSAAYLPKSKEAFDVVSSYLLKAIAVKFLSCSQNRFKVSESSLDLKEIQKIVEMSSLKRYSKGQAISFVTGGFLISGKLGKPHQNKIYFESAKESSVVHRDAVFLHFSIRLAHAIFQVGNFKVAVKRLYSYSEILQPQMRQHRVEGVKGKSFRALKEDESFQQY